MHIRFYILFPMLLSIYGCDFNKEQLPVKTHTYCPQQLTLLTYTDSHPVPLKSNMSPEAIKECIRKVTGQQNFEQNFYYSILLDTDKKCEIPLKIFHEAEGISDIRVRSTVNILINRNNSIYINSQKSDTGKSMALQLKEAMLQARQDYGMIKTQIILQADQHASTDCVEKCIADISEGYLLFADSISINYYGKSICNLDSVSLERIHGEIPFRLNLTYDSRRLAPPPPLPQMH